MKRIHAPETARLLGHPVTNGVPDRRAVSLITTSARDVARLQAKAARLRRELRTVETAIREAKRRLRLAASSIAPLEEGELP